MIIWDREPLKNSTDRASKLSVPKRESNVMFKLCFGDIFQWRKRENVVKQKEKGTQK